MMRKIFIIYISMFVFALTAGTVSAQFTGSYNAGPSAMNLSVGSCETRTISVDGSSWGTSRLVSGGMLVTNSDSTKVAITTVACYDGELTPALWDAGVFKVPNPDGYPGGYFVAASNLGAGVTPASTMMVCDMTFCSTAAGSSTITIDTVPDFDTWVNQVGTVFDPYINSAVITITGVGQVCQCGINGPAEVTADDVNPVTAQYSAAGNANCTNAPVYEWSDTCALGDVNQTGLLTVPATTVGETCTITITDTANVDVNTGEQVSCSTGVNITGGSPPAACAVEIALGRSCPGKAIDDPAYNRPGRRGLAATCDDVIDFTVCSDCVPFDPSCLVWSVDPAASYLSIEQIDSCCWRMSIGNSCKQLDKIEEYQVTVTDTCNNTSDSVVIEIGKVIVDVGDTTVQPETESTTVNLDLINPEHHVRALLTDIAECAGGEDNLVCTGCMIDSNRALDFTCSANELPDGSCRVVLYSTNPAALILQGRGTVAQVIYQAGDANVGDCVCLRPVNIQISDPFNEDLCACQQTGEVCFKTCGDIYPQDCIGGPCADTDCGDGVVDILDILEGLDIVLGLQTATVCQIGNGDAPNGVPPYCGNPPGTPNCEGDGDIDVFDVLVMIDKALGKMNCCDYCLFGEIY